MHDSDIAILDETKGRPRSGIICGGSEVCGDHVPDAQVFDVDFVIDRRPESRFQQQLKAVYDQQSKFHPQDPLKEVPTGKSSPVHH